MNTIQHKFEKIESAKIICGKCSHVWYMRLHQMDDFEVCPECESMAIVNRVQHIVQRGEMD